jgi:hypothetical protein
MTSPASYCFVCYKCLTAPILREARKFLLKKSCRM